MITRALHAVIVRMLHDPALCAAVHADPDAALADTPLSPEERRWLAAADPRAWEVDTLRAPRLLGALVDEHRVTVNALASLGWRLEDLHAFFQSRHFHDAVAAWGSLFFAFSDFLAARLTHRRAHGARAMLAIEGAIARVRRSRPDPAIPPGALLLSPASAPLCLPAGSAALWQRHHDHLQRAEAEGPGRATAMVIGALPSASRKGRGQAALPRPLPFSAASLRADEDEGLMVRQEPGAEPALSFIGEGLVAILEGARAPTAMEALHAIALMEGADAEDIDEIMDDLIESGHLLRGADRFL